jgi:putative ABC transport system permease protein
MALGASRGGILAMVLRQGLVLVAIGLVLGAIAAIVLSRVLTALLFDTTSTDPVAFAAVAVAFVVAGALACLGPAFRATTVDPVYALRSE